MQRYEMLQQGKEATLHTDYLGKLYKLGEKQTFALPYGTRFQGTIIDVEPQGALKIADTEGQEHKFLFKEVEFVLKN